MLEQYFPILLFMLFGLGLGALLLGIGREERRERFEGGSVRGVKRDRIHNVELH